MGEEESYKAGARCRFFSICSLYTAGTLREEVEKSLCGREQPIDKDYVPRIQKVYTPKPEAADVSGVGDTCPAYSGYIDKIVLGKIVKFIEMMEWYHDGKILLDDIINE